jgi:hypothetical protein
VYDTLHGLFSSQDILGPSEDQNTTLTETYSWLEHPGNIRSLFDPAVQERELREAVACYFLRSSWTAKDQQMLNLRYACAYIAGNESKKAISRLDQSNDSALLLLKRLDELESRISKVVKQEGDEYFLRILSDLLRHRLHVKFYRFAHRALNRINVVTNAKEIQLARAGGALYELVDPEELKEAQGTESEIIHHVMLKADIRGSTTVTIELLNQKLNPASYFSLRFLNPINERLEIYGADKVFIEGDDVILGFYEENNAPNHWYAMSRACGMAKEILDIIGSKNSHAAKTGLPGLEVGIGICFSDDKPIMISSAIGDADRLSPCSWRLRNSYKGHFNVDVMEMDESDEQLGEKGQRQIQYNLNGIMLSQPGFKKLISEILLKKLKLKTGESSQTMFVGKFPDVLGKERDLVICEGRVGLWKDGIVQPDRGDEPFYEVLPNSKLASQVLELARKSG